MSCPHCQIKYDPRHWKTCPHCGAGGNGATNNGEKGGSILGVLRTSTILIATGNHASETYRSVDEVPEPLRRMLVQSTTGLNSGTIYIADRRGRDQMAYARRKAAKPTPAIEAARPFAIPSLLPSEEERSLQSSPAWWLSLIIMAFGGAVIWLLGARPW